LAQAAGVARFILEVAPGGATLQHVMSELIDQLTSLTRLRDGDGLDTAMAHLALDMVQARRVGVHRLVFDHGAQRWLTTAVAEAPGRRVRASLPGTGWQRDECPLWLGCLAQQQPRLLGGPVHGLLHPLAPLSEPSAGVIEIHTEQAPTPEQQRLIGSLMRFYRQLRDLIDENERDSLTGLLNRKSFDETFVRAAQGVPMPGMLPGAGAWWLGLVDIDHFKRVNDVYGHLIGDEVLLLVAQLMRRSFGFSDRLYRFGGEEFIVLLHAADMAQACTAFDRLRLEIETHEFPQVQRLTVSIGYTAVDGDDTPSSAFARADAAVYAAKQGGRNRIVAHGDALGEAAVKPAPVFGAVEFF